MTPPPAPSSSRASGTRADVALVVNEDLVGRPESGSPGAEVAGPSAAAGPSVSVAAAADPAAAAADSAAADLAVSRFVAVGEVKRYGKMVHPDGKPLDLIDLFQKEPPAAGQNKDPRLQRSMRRIMRQLFTYMVVTGVEFGWLRCYFFTWLAWRPLEGSQSHLYLSRPFGHRDVHQPWVRSGVTAMAALSWLQDQAMSRTYGLGLRHPTGPLPVPAELSESEDSSHDHDKVPQTTGLASTAATRTMRRGRRTTKRNLTRGEGGRRMRPRHHPLIPLPPGWTFLSCTPLLWANWA